MPAPGAETVSPTKKPAVFRPVSDFDPAVKVAVCEVPMFAGSFEENVLVIVTDGCARGARGRDRERGRRLALVDAPDAESVVTVDPLKKSVPPKLCGIVIELRRRNAGLLFVIVMLTLPGACKLPLPRRLSPSTVIVPASAKMGLTVTNGTASCALVERGPAVGFGETQLRHLELDLLEVGLIGIFGGGVARVGDQQRSASVCNSWNRSEASDSVSTVKVMGPVTE